MPGTVLVVEDAPEVREALVTLLQTEGYDVVCCENGQDAADLLASTPELPGLILLDLMMPVMDGFAFLRWQAEHPRGRDIPVIVLSAIPRAAAGLTSEPLYVQKPPEVQKLLTMVAACCT